MLQVKKAAVIGAGVMGAAIAAQLANAGVEVDLLDIVPKGLGKDEDRNKIAKGAIDRLLKDKPAPLMHKRNARRLTPGNIEDNLDRLKDADLIIEAVLENPKIKTDLYKKVDKYRKPDAVIGSNTSTIPLEKLGEGQSEDFVKHLVITHFFNPPRYMPLLEIVSNDKNDAAKVKALEEFMDRRMGKTVIHCRDTPGFIANRIGTNWLTVSLNEAKKLGLTPEEADGIAGKPMGFPEGVLSLIDRVGLDLMPHISESLLKNIPADDPYRQEQEDHPLLTLMIENGYTGRKGKGGFFRMNKEGGKKQLEMVDLYRTDEIAYTPVTENLKMKSAGRSKKDGLKGVMGAEDIEGQYAWQVLKKTLSYAAAMIPEINNDLTNIDEAMKLGYNWKKGPFEMIDEIGVDHFINRLKEDGEDIPPFLNTAAGKSFYTVRGGQLMHLTVEGSYKAVTRPEGVLLLEDIKRAKKPVSKNPSAKLWDIGDGVLCIEFTSHSNSMDPLNMWMLNKARRLIEENDKYVALVIHNEGKFFSAGANIKLAELAARFKQHWLIDKIVDQGQDTYRKLKYASFPVVAAPSGVALGGGCEIILHADAVQAHAETYMGLVEPGVGLIPGWGGCTEMLCRALRSKKTGGGPMPAVSQTFETIAMTKVSPSAEEAQSLHYLSPDDGITMNKRRLLADAKARALELVEEGYTPPEPQVMRLPGPAGRAALRLAVNDMFKKGVISTYAVVLADQLGEVLTGGPNGDVSVEIDEDEIRRLERVNFKKLVRDRRTIQRVMYMLRTNKALDMNKKYLKQDHDCNVTVDELRHSLEDATDLKGNHISVSQDVRNKIQPSIDAADDLLERQDEKKDAEKLRRTPDLGQDDWTVVEKRS